MSNKAVDKLNDLIEYARDGQHGYKQAADKVENTELKQMFNQCAQQRGTFISELNQQIRTLGGSPDDSGSVTGDLHRGWINLKSALTSGDESAILAECERGDEAAVNEYKDVLQASSLPETAVGVVRRQQQEIQSTLGQIKTLKERM